MAKSSLDKKFDKIREREESKSFSTKKRSRIISKFVNNKLAVFGLIIFSISANFSLLNSFTFIQRLI